MPVELTPAGTRGVSIRQPPKWLMGLAQPLFDMVLGRRMRLLKLTTVGASRERAPRLAVLFSGRPGRLVRRGLVRRIGQAPRLVLQHGQAPGPIWIELDGRRSASTPKPSPARSALRRGARSSPGGRATPTTRPAPIG